MLSTHSSMLRLAATTASRASVALCHCHANRATAMPLVRMTAAAAADGVQRRGAHTEGAESAAASSHAAGATSAGAVATAARPFAAVQFGRHGHVQRYTLAPSSAGSADGSGAALVSTPLTKPSDEAMHSEKQQLLQALFSAPIRDTASATTPAPTPSPFSPRWYPLASLLMLLLPQHYPASVSSCYLSYSKWMFVGACFGSASGVLSMQCLLHSVVVGTGLGEAAAGSGSALLPAAAAISWVLKDGVGQLGGILFASFVSTRFDLSPRRWRMASALVLDASVGLEMLTVLLPAWFLPLAALANTGKNISWLGAAAAKAEIHRSFLVGRNNLADVTAKSGSQTILASLIGTALGISLSLLTGSELGALMVAFAGLSMVHLLSTRRALQHVVLRQLSPDRIRMLSGHFVRQMQQQHATTYTSPPLPSIPILLSTPAELQRTEPLILTLRARTIPGAPASSPSSSSSLADHPATWSRSSSVDSGASFDTLCAAVLKDPSLHGGCSPDAATAQTTTVLLDRWSHQFTELPFIASLELASASSSQGVELASSVTEASSMLARVRSKFASIFTTRSAASSSSSSKYVAVATAATAGEEDVENGGSAHPHAPLPHLHIRLMFKSGCTSEQLLLASLYTSHMRRGWAAAAASAVAMGEQRDGRAAPAAAASIAQKLHAEALEIMRADAEGPPLLDVSQEDATDATSAVTCSTTAPLPHRSLFVHALRTAGYHTTSHFVEDDNPVRVQLESQSGVNVA